MESIELYCLQWCLASLWLPCIAIREKQILKENQRELTHVGIQCDLSHTGVILEFQMAMSNTCWVKSIILTLMTN